MNHEFRGRTVNEAIECATRSWCVGHSLHSAAVEIKSNFSVWAPPLLWGPWQEIFAVFGVIGQNADDSQIRKTISYQTLSQAKSTFDIEIRGGDRFISAVGPGSSDVTITGNVATALSIRAKSHSLGQQIRVSVR